MAIEKVREYLNQFGVADKMMEFEVSSATVELAAQAVGVEGKRIAKTLSFLLPEEKPILIVCAGDAKVDNHKFKEQFKTKAKMIPFDDVERYIGHAVGGVCPFGINPDVDVYLDDSLKRFETVFPAVGNDASAIEFTLDELEKYSQNFVSWIDISKLPE